MKMTSFHDSGNKRVKQIVHVAMKEAATVQKRSVSHIAAEYKVKWNMTKELIESNIDEVLNIYDTLTGLCLFMVAAMKNDSFSRDLSSIYDLMRMNQSYLRYEHV